jgi:hypothetical protein
MRVSIVILSSFFFLLAREANGQSNVYRVKFNSSGAIENINTLQFLSRVHDKGKLRLSFSFNLNDSLVLAHYKNYYERRLSVIAQLLTPEVKNELDWFYDIGNTEVNAMILESKFYINSVPPIVKESFGYPNVEQDVGGHHPPSTITVFSPYSIEVTGYTKEGKDGIVVSSSNNPDLRSKVITYNIELPGKKSVERINYKIRFNKPIQSEFNKGLNLVTNVPSEAEYRPVADSLAKAAQIIEDFDEWFKASFPIATRRAKREHIFKVKVLLTNEERVIDAYYKRNANFVRNWLWYTGGIPKLNPFGTTDGEKKLANYDSLITSFRIDSVNISSRLADLEKKYTLYTESIVKVNLKDKLTVTEANNAVLTAVDQINQQLQSQRILRNKKSKTLDSLRIMNNSLIKEQRKKSAAFNEFNIKDVFLYDGYSFAGRTRFLSSPKKLIYYRNYNRADGLKPFQNYPLSYDQTTTLYILVENETKRNFFSVRVKEIENEETPFAAAVNGPLDQLGTVGKIPTMKSNQILTIAPEVNEDTTDVNLVKINELKKRIAYYKKTLVKPPSFPASFKSDTEPERFTDYYHAVFPDTTKSSYQYTTTISQGTKKFETKFRVNKVYRVLPCVGLVFSNADDPEVILNDDGTIKEVNYFNETSVMLGLKVYPFGGSPIYDRHFFVSNKRRPYVDYRKIHVVAGINAIQPLKQFYLGAGVDLWSGLSISSGFHAISKKQQKMVSGAVEEKNYLDYKNVYVSISVDVSVAIKIIGLISKRI